MRVLWFGIKIALWFSNGTCPRQPQPSRRNFSSEHANCVFAYTAAMRFLVLDTADARGSVALFKEGVCLCVEAHANEEDYSSWLLPAVKRVLTNMSVSLSELDGYAVCAGPGSFTGLRIGLTTVKAWAEIYRKPIAAVSRLEAIASDVPGDEPGEACYVAACIDARRDQVFAALYLRSAPGLSILGEESVVGFGAFAERVKADSGGKHVVWRTPEPEALRTNPAWQELAGQGHTVEEVKAPFSERLGRIAFAKFKAGSTTNSLELDANYVRRSDAEVFWKGNGSAVKT